MLRRSLQIAQILSLDVVLGAIISSIFVARFLGYYLPASQWGALGMAVWLIYTADHLADAQKIKHPAHSARHRYHQRHFKAIRNAWFVVAAAGLYILTLLPLSLITWGIGLTLLVGLYFLLIRLLPHSRFFHKEFIIAFLYTAGIFLAPIHYLSEAHALPIILFFVEYFLLALTNVLLISWYEQDIDRADGQHSFVIVAGDETGKFTIKSCLSLLYTCILFSVLYFRSYDKLLLLQFVLLIMGITLHSIMLRQSLFAKQGRYRFWADAIFYFPTIYLLVT